MISLFWVPSQRYPMGNYKVECVLHQTNKQNSARARRTKNTYSSKVHPIYGCTLCSFTEPFSGASGGRARRARRALVRVNLMLRPLGRFAFGKTPRGPRCARQARQRLAKNFDPHDLSLSTSTTTQKEFKYLHVELIFAPMHLETGVTLEGQQSLS